MRICIVTGLKRVISEGLPSRSILPYFCLPVELREKLVFVWRGYGLEHRSGLAREY